MVKFSKKQEAGMCDKNQGHENEIVEQGGLRWRICGETKILLNKVSCVEKDENEWPVFVMGIPWGPWWRRKDAHMMF